MSDKLPCCGNDKVILVDISRDDFRQIKCSSCGAKFWQNKKTGELSLKNFEPKRSWTPAPWSIDDIAVGVRLAENVFFNRLLASKSPDMAELLIKITDKIVRAWKYDDFYDMEFEKLFDDAMALLKEIGYEPNQD